MEDVVFYVREGIQREAIFKNGRFYDVSSVAILKKDYLKHKEAGEYEVKNIIKRIVKLKKIQNK